MDTALNLTRALQTGIQVAGTGANVAALASSGNLLGALTMILDKGQCYSGDDISHAFAVVVRFLICRVFVVGTCSLRFML